MTCVCGHEHDDDATEVIGCGPHACRIPGDPPDLDDPDDVDGDPT